MAREQVKTIFVPGGMGYIGSHACVELIAAGYEVVVLDNLSNSRRSVATRVARIAGRGVTFVEGDIRDASVLDKVFASHSIDVVMHFAGLKAVGESVQKPLLYYENNVGGTLALVAAMQRAKVHRMVFSSSATVYGDAAPSPYREDAPLCPINPYGRTKLMIEQILTDLSASGPDWKVVLLRYFNPVGAHESGMLGEDPDGIPNNLMPYVSQVAAGKLAQLSVFGNDYPTPDGTGVRDYIHVVDLALGHVAALRAIEALPSASAFNLGTGCGRSVLELVKAYEKACGRPVPFKIAPRRAGDLPAYYADPSKAASQLGWSAKRDLDAMCSDAWRWQQWQAGHTDEL